MKVDGRWISCVTVQEFQIKIYHHIDFFHTHSTSFFISDNLVFDKSQWHVSFKTSFYSPSKILMNDNCGLNGLFEHETVAPKCSNTKWLTTQLVSTIVTKSNFKSS